MTRAPRLMRLAATAAVSAVLLSGCGISLQTLPLLGVSTSHTYPLHARFADALNLADGAPVRLGDDTVGTVSAIAAVSGVARVTMRIQDHYRIPADATASVRFITPLGDQYVQLDTPTPATAAALAPGATIGLERTSAAASVEDTLAAAGTLLFGGGLGQVQTLTSELNQILGGNQPQIRHLLANVNTAVTSLAAHDSDIDQALSSISQLSAQIDQGRGAIVAALDTLPAAAATLAADNPQITALLQAINQLSPQVVQLAQRSGSVLTSDSQSLAPVVAQLASVDGQLQADLATVETFARRTTRAIPGDYLQGHLIINVVNHPLPLEVPTLTPLVQCVLGTLLGSASSCAASTTPPASAAAATSRGAASSAPLLEASLP